jgi:hypothetical protein
MRYAMTTLLLAALATPLLGGCGDKKVEESQSQSTNPLTGTTTTKDQTTYQRSDGSTYTDTQEHKSN